MAEGIGIHTSGGLASTDSRRKTTEFQIRADVAVLSLKAENSKFLSSENFLGKPQCLPSGFN